jgi:uncharacterized protein YpiB (UPF0302 family)
MINQSKKQPVAVLAKTDEVCLSTAQNYQEMKMEMQINYLMRLILYVERNEDTACIKLVHFVDAEKGVPSELEANSKSETIGSFEFLQKTQSFSVLDEAFPEITIDLVRPINLFP